MEKPRVRIQAGDLTGATARIADVAGATRAKASVGVLGPTPGLEGGAAARRMAAFRPSRQHINAITARYGGTATARALHLYRNSPYINAAAEVWAANGVGDGIAVIPLAPAKADELAALFADWCEECDAEGLTDFAGQQSRAARTEFVIGEAFFRIRWRRPDDGLVVPFQLQQLPASRLPLDKTEALPNGNVIRQGVEFNRIGQRVAYHILRNDPADPTDPSAATGALDYVRIPADEILHVFDPTEEGQVRGISRVATAIARSHALDTVEDAETERQRIQSLFAGFIRKTDPDAGMGMGDDDAATDDGAGLLGLEPGSLQVLLPGEDVTFATPPGVSGSYEPFQYRALTAIAAGLGVPYMEMTGDLSRANYSSMRSGMVAFKKRMRAYQRRVLIHQLVRPVFRLFVREAVLAGAIELPGYLDNPRAFERAEYRRPAWDWVDPLKDVQAAILEIEAGIRDRSSVIAENGDSAAAVDERRKADVERERALGLSAPAPRPPVAMPDDDENEDEAPARPAGRPAANRRRAA